MEDQSNVLFVRGANDDSSEDVWDDSALIKAYDKAINLAKDEVAKRLGLKKEESPSKKDSVSRKENRQAKKSQRKWTVGSPCRAVYSEDGVVYEAIIIKIFENTRTCLVKFIGYNNEEKVELSSLLESEGLQSQTAQQKEAIENVRHNSMDCEEPQNPNTIPPNPMEYEMHDSKFFEEPKSFKNLYNHGSFYNPAIGAMPPAPPLPPQLLARLPENDEDALSSMLMSWYISGFHTGYYHGMQQAQGKKNQKKK